MATVPEDEIEEVYALRAHLEAHAARRVVVERRDEALAVLGELLDQMLVAASEKKLPAVADLDLQFHDALLELSGYQGLHRIWRSMDGLVRARTYATLALPGREELIEYTAASHRPLLTPFEPGDSGHRGRGRETAHPRSSEPDGREPAGREHALTIATYDSR